jgi:hypothetical protein
MRCRSSPPHFINWLQDPFGNFLARIAVPEKTDHFMATVDLLADMAAINPFDFFVDEGAGNWPFAYEGSLAGELRPYLEPLPGTPLLDGYVGQIEAAGPTTVELITGLNRALARDIAYRTRMEEGVQTPEETLSRRSGSCRDSGWLLVQLLRRFGLAARFVSGYLVQLGPDEPPAEGPAGARRTRPTCTPGPRSTCPEPVDRPRSHFGPARGRGPPAPGSHPFARERGADCGHARPGRGGFLRIDACRAHARGAARSQALQRRAMAGFARGGRRCGEPAESRRRASQHGRRADLRSARRWRGAR